jgi:hypothetical protein
MRRLLSILLVALFWAGPMSALLPANTDAQLPACCRRHGAHHCAMGRSDSAQPSAGHAFAAPAHCPLYHRSGPATPTFTAAAQPSLAQLPQASALTASTRTAVLHRARSLSSRGPPLAP